MTIASTLAALPPADFYDLPFGFASIREAIAQGADPVAIVLESRRRAGAVAHEGVFTALVPEQLVPARARRCPCSG
jgi:allophanate hydrolase